MTTQKMSTAAAAEASATAPPARGRHVPDAGSPDAEAIEKARADMLHEARITERGRIGADALCEALINQGVDIIFGYPGGVILPLYDVWADYPELRTILVRHEQGAAHAADGYARASGRVGVCLGTSGPGATNLVTGIATAQLDSVPMVALTGNVPGALLGKDAFQEIDISGITLPMTKHNYLVRNADDIPRVIAEAFHIARTGRPGPVHVDFTKDALTSETQAQNPTTLNLPGFKPRADGHPRQVKLAAKAIAASRRPVILAGHGVLIADATDELRTFAHKAQIPVTHTLLGVGAIDETDPLSYGYMGMHGWKHVNKAIQSADLLIALGMRFDDRVTGSVSTYAPNAQIIHVDIDPSEIGKNVAVDIPIVGDVGNVLRALIKAVPAGRSSRARGLLRGAVRVAHGLRVDLVAWLGWLEEGPADRRLRDAAAGRADRPRRHARLGRGPAPDVARPLRGLQAPQQPPLLGRPGDHGLRPAGSHGRGPRAPRQGDLGGGR